MNLLERIPPSYRAGPEMAEIQRVAGLFVDRLWADVELWQAQLSVETATVGLEVWERAVGIQPDLTLSLDWRRSKIKAKLQGTEVSKPSVIAAIVARFTGGDVQVVEDAPNYLLKLVVDGVLNPPENMAALRHSVAEIKPAHLAHEYALSYQSGLAKSACAMVVRQVKGYRFALEGRA